ncbi:MAG: hypothetical protein AB1777_12085 [Bacteroidota bacterium]
MPRKVLSFVAFALLFSCASNRNAEKAGVKDDHVPFIEFYTITEGKALSGAPVQGRRIDGPGYSYNPETQKLDIYRNNLSDSLNIKLYLGVGKVLKGTAGQGVSSTVIGVSNFPYTVNNLTISKATNTIVYCLLKGKRFELRPGQEYLITESKTDSLPNSSVVQTTTTWKVTFTGFVNQNQ